MNAKHSSGLFCIDKRHILVFCILAGILCLVIISSLNQRTSKSLSSKASIHQELESSPLPPDTPPCRRPGDSCCTGNICDGYFENVVCDQESKRCMENTSDQCGRENERCCLLKWSGNDWGSAICRENTVCQTKYLSDVHRWYGINDLRNNESTRGWVTCIKNDTANQVIAKNNKSAYVSIKVSRRYAQKFNGVDLGEDYTDINAKDVDAYFLPILASDTGLKMYVRSEVLLGEKYELEYNCNMNEGAKKVDSESAVIEVICPYKSVGKYQLDVSVKIFGSKESSSYVEMKSSGKFTLVKPTPTPLPASIPSCGDLNPGGNVRTQPLAIDKDLDLRTQGNIAIYCEQKYPGYKPCVHVYRNQEPTNETLTRYECGLAYK